MALKENQRGLTTDAGQLALRLARAGAVRAPGIEHGIDELELENAPNDEVRQRIIQGRIRHLENEIRAFEKGIRDAGGTPWVSYESAYR